MKTLRDALRQEELTLSAELSLRPGQSAIEILEQAKTLSAAADAIQVPDNRNALPHMSNIAVASLLRQEGLDPVVHMNSRDRNRIAFQSDLLGAQGIGVTNLLLMRGESLAKRNKPRIHGIFDIKAVEMIAKAASIRDGGTFAGVEFPGASELFIGSVATVFNPETNWQPEKLIEKADAGAQFIQLQVCLDMDILREYMAALVAAKLMWRFNVLVGLAVLPSADAARRMRQLQPDSIIPAALMKRLEHSTDAEAEGVKVCAELLQELSQIPGVAGANIMTPGDPDSIPAAVHASGLRASA